MPAASSTARSRWTWLRRDLMRSLCGFGCVLDSSPTAGGTAAQTSTPAEPASCLRVSAGPRVSTGLAAGVATAAVLVEIATCTTGAARARDAQGEVSSAPSSFTHSILPTEGLEATPRVAAAGPLVTTAPPSIGLRGPHA